MCFTLPKIAENVSAWYIENDSWKLPTDLFYAYPGFAHHEDVHMLIVELFFHLLHPGRYSSNGRVPTLQNTGFWWILAEHIQHPGKPFRVAASSHLTLEENSLDAQLQHFWACEEFQSPPKTTLEPECESRCQATTTPDDTGRFVTHLPWKSNQKGLGSACDQTLYRFQQLEKWLQHQPDIQKNHTNFMKEYEEPEHMQLVSGDNGKVTFYLPHHLVF